MAQTTEFTYQGYLQVTSAPANGSFDFEFLLFDSLAGTNQLAMTITRINVPVANGIFTVNLDFGPSFPGAGRFLEIHTRQTMGGAFVPLSPRQPVTSTPYSIKSVTAASADSLNGVLGAVNGGTGIGPMPPPANTYLRSNGAGWQASGISSVDIPSGSSNYIQNGTGSQAASNFNISGNGTVGGTVSAFAVNSNSEYRLGGQPFANAIGSNSRFGLESGSPSGGVANTYAGYRAGAAATSNTSNNAFFGSNAGMANSNGSSNAFFGGQAGENNTFGGSNSFFGISAGASNTVGGANTAIGAFANVGSGNLNFATAIGAGATVSSSNTIVLGRFSETVQIPGTLTVSGAITGNITNATNAEQLGGVAAAQFVQTTDPRLSDARTPLAGSSDYIQNGTGSQASSNFNVSGTGTANIFNAGTQYNIANNRLIHMPGFETMIMGVDAGGACSSCAQTTIVGQRAGRFATGSGHTFLGSGAGAFTGFGGPSNRNTFIGLAAGQDNTTGSDNTALGYLSKVGSNLSNATAIGAQASATQSNSLVLGAGVNVGIGTTAPKAKLHVAGGSIYIASPNSLVITSPNGSCFFITVNDAGGLSTIPVTCP